MPQECNWSFTAHVNGRSNRSLFCHSCCGNMPVRGSALPPTKTGPPGRKALGFPLSGCEFGQSLRICFSGSQQCGRNGPAFGSESDKVTESLFGSGAK